MTENIYHQFCFEKHDMHMYNVHQTEIEINKMNRFDEESSKIERLHRAKDIKKMLELYFKIFPKTGYENKS